MLDIIRNNLLPCTLNVITVIYLLSKILKNKFDFKDYKNYFAFVLLIVLSIVNFIYVQSFLRFFISTIYTILCAKIMFSDKIYKTVTAVILEQVLIFLSELIYMLFMIVIFKIDDLAIFGTIVGSLIPNVLICSTAVLLVNTQLVKIITDKLMGFMEKIKQKNKYILTLFVIITLNVLLAIIYITSKNLIMVIINVVFIFAYSYIVYSLLNEKNLNVKFKEENEFLIENLNEYEKMLDYQRVTNHENKNQLLVIKTMVNKNNKKIHAYLDEIIEEKREDDEILYASAARIPSGGLQGLVYQKMLYSKENNININLNVSNDVRKINMSKLDAKTNFDICRIIGVFIDNAIEETMKLEDKEISISMYKEGKNFIIEIGNKCKQIPNLQKIDNKGYTTKEKGHGYGLSLVKEICEKSKDIKNERKIVGNIFFQIIKIRI